MHVETKTVTTETIRLSAEQIWELVMEMVAPEGFSATVKYRYEEDLYDGYKTTYFDGYELTKVTETK